jgi:hypothetical protein
MLKTCSVARLAVARLRAVVAAGAVEAADLRRGAVADAGAILDALGSILRISFWSYFTGKIASNIRVQNCVLHI